MSNEGDEHSSDEIQFVNEFAFDISACQDEKVRRNIRRQYRDLSEETQARIDKINEIDPEEVKTLIERTGELFGQVTMTREAALDSQQMNLCAQILKRNTESLSANFSEFKPLEFAEKLVGLLSNPIEADDDGDNEDIILEENWVEFGKEVLPFFKKSPSFHLMYGTFEASDVRPERRRRARTKDEEAVNAVVPKQISEIQKSEQETTTEEVERVLGILKALYKKNREELCYFSFIVDPTSFTRTLENIFHFSFLVKDGLAGIGLDNHKLPVIWPIEEVAENNGSQEASQLLLALSMDDWQEIVEAFKITKPCIKPRTADRGGTHREF